MYNDYTLFPTSSENAFRQINSAAISCSNKLKRNFYQFSESRAITYPCKCEESRCSCCSGNILQNFNLNLRQRLCTNISYDADEFEFNVRILFNDYTMFNRVVSGMVRMISFNLKCLYRDVLSHYHIHKYKILLFINLCL